MAKTNVQKEYEEKTKIALSKIKNLNEFREDDKMVDEVFKIGRFLYDEDLDRVAEQTLVRLGGRLTGIYAYLGNIASRARAERDIAENIKDEMLAQKAVDLYGDTEKITMAKAQAKVAVIDLENDVIAKEQAKNNYENLMNACDKMIGFIQSALKVKLGEKYKTSRDYDNG